MPMHRRLLATAFAALGLMAAPASAQTAGPVQTCKADAKFREQDFTVGTWDVFAAGKKAAEVSMALVLEDCAIEEHWTVTDGRPNGNGIGLFTYSRLLGSWGYSWATDAGAATGFRGSQTRPGEMLYVTEKPLPGGKVRLRHWTLTAQPDGTIRELSVGSEDGGATWMTEYDLKWVRQK
jgi:hypothetical protein